MVSSIKPDDAFTQWRSEYESDILVSLASLAGERMFFDEDSSSGVSSDLQAATTVASLMEGFWGMGSTVSSLAASQTLQVGMPGGGGGGGGGRENVVEQARKALADRIEENLTRLLRKAEELLRENEAQVLALAHALEIYKTLSSEDLAAVIEGHAGPVVDGTPYANPAFIQELRYYHEAAARAHRDHSRPDIPIPRAPQLVAASVVAEPYGLNAYETATGAIGSTGIAGTGNGITGNGSGLRTGSYGDIFEDTRDDVIIEDTRDDLASQGPDDDGFYEPPTYGPPEGPSSNGHPNGQS
jgi:hypothetical protein